jgi:hypothetical protein
MANPPSWAALNPASAPDSFPIGVRAPLTMTDPGMCLVSLVAADRANRQGSGEGAGRSPPMVIFNQILRLTQSEPQDLVKDDYLLRPADGIVDLTGRHAYL